MPSDRAMPIAPMLYADFTPMMLAGAFAGEPSPGRAFLGLVGKAGPRP